MLRATPRHVSLLVLTAALTFGCRDATAPATQSVPSIPVPPPSLELEPLEPVEVDTSVLPLFRDAPLDHDYTVAASIGPRGGSLHIRQAGVRLDIPAGALGEATTITLTARRGWLCDYDFGPHGTRFAVPVKITQDLAGTVMRAHRQRLHDFIFRGAYYDSDHVVLGSHFTTRVDEIEPTDVDVRARLVRFYVRHFSGYVVALGYKSAGGATKSGY